MSDQGQEAVAAQKTGTIFAICISFVLFSLLLEYCFSFFQSEDAEQGNTTPSPESTDKKESSSKIEVKTEETRKYGLFRRISQKKEQTFLNFPAAFSIIMLLITLVQLFVQIFDVLTDSIITGTFLDEDKHVEAAISFALIIAPLVAKWVSFGKYIDKKCRQGQLPRELSFFNFFFPLGVFFPFIAHLYIISRMIKGHAISLWTGRPFKLDDELFCLQRTFALLEAQIESLPQALFQLTLLCLGKTSDTAIVTLSVAVSISSLILQIIQLAAVARRESYPSIFSLVEALSRGDFMSGVNKIKENTSSILNLFNVAIDRVKMDVVSEIVSHQPGLRTVILNPNVLSHSIEFIEPPFFGPFAPGKLIS